MHEVNNFYEKLTLILFGNVNFVQCKFKVYVYCYYLIIVISFGCLFCCNTWKFNIVTGLSSYIPLTLASYALKLYYIITHLAKLLISKSIGNNEFTVEYTCLKCS